MDTPPWAVALVGMLAGAIGGFLTFAGIDDGVAGVTVIGWALSALGGVVLFVGLVAVAVQLGVRAAR